MEREKVWLGQRNLEEVSPQEEKSDRMKITAAVCESAWIEWATQSELFSLSILVI